MSFLNEKFDDETQKMMINLFELKGMKIQFLASNKIEAQTTSLTIAINDENTKGSWKYFNFDDNNLLVVKLFPIEIIKHAKEYKAHLLLKEKENEQ